MERVGLGKRKVNNVNLVCIYKIFKKNKKKKIKDYLLISSKELKVQFKQCIEKIIQSRMMSRISQAFLWT